MHSLRSITMTPFDLIVRSPTNVFSWVTLLPLTACDVTIAYNGMPKRLSPLAKAFPYGTLSARLSSSCLHRFGRTA
jgi:hypothetical protein